jgi:UDP-N-acetylglucosamine--N-acetylmuramyl-(pentapeptide) pyrophosphoryl-undecaprenol N-acetylglucosamine transferase
METGLVQRAGIPFKGIPAAGLHGVGLRRLPGNLAALARGFFAARAILDEFKPDALFFTGGYVAGPVALAGMRIPSLVYVPDIEPGLALKGLSLFAARIAVTVEESKQFFSSTAQVVVTGYPSRPDMSAWERVSARQEFNIQTSLPVLLVWGGSRGARSINIALLDHLDTLLETMEIIHISGELDWPVVQERIAALNPEQAARYHAFAYLHEQMGAALAAADLVVSRAGASTLGEFPLYGLPAILVPYPYAWRYQKVNAEYLASRNAAIIMEDAKLKSGLYLTVERLLDTPEKLEKMRQAMTSLRNPGAAAQIAGYLRELAGVNHG